MKLSNKIVALLLALSLLTALAACGSNPSRGCNSERRDRGHLIYPRS